MRIVNLRAFLAMPDGTIFQKYAPCYFGELEIKIENCGERDFITADLTGMPIAHSGTEDMTEKLDSAEQDGISLPVDFENTGRDGMFDDDQLFAVWEEADIAALIEKLRNPLG